MSRYGPKTIIHSIKITNARGGSINFGPSIHKGHQANSKFITDEFVIGDEFNFGCPNGEEEENNENNNEEKCLKNKVIIKNYNGKQKEENEAVDEGENKEDKDPNKVEEKEEDLDKLIEKLENLLKRMDDKL